MMSKLNSPIFGLLFGVLAASVFQPTSVTSDEPYKIICYLGSWANYRPGNGKFLIENIDPSLCTHLIYGFAKLGPDNRIAPFDPYLDLKENWGLGAYDRFNNLRKLNPRLKTLIAIGGWNEGSTKYSIMASTQATRKVFVESIIDFIERHGFDGLDLDWEYPATRGGSPEDKENHVLLLKELKDVLAPRGLLLTAAVAAGEPTILAAYDVPSVARYLDFINLMAYDFHGAWEQVTGHNAPLYPRPGDSEQNIKFTVDYAVRTWISLGASPEKIILGMPLYGRTFTLQDPSKTTFGSPTTGGGEAGPFTREPGMIGFNEMCNKLRKESGWKVARDDYYKAPYAYRRNQWIGYDDVDSIAVKVNYIKKMKLGGGMVWSLETDDFRGECEQLPYPLLTTIVMELLGKPFPEFRTTSSDRNSSGLIPLPSSTPANEQEPTDDDKPSTNFCTEPGYFRYPLDCTKFYACTPNINGGFNIYWFTCPPGTLYSQQIGTCNFPSNVPECNTV